MDGKRWIPAGVLLLVVVAALLYGPIGQPPGYHEFADRRTLLGLPNAADVLSNLGFALVGLWGLWNLLRKRQHSLGFARSGYCLFLGALVLTALGSSYYHLAPDNDRLLWDRLPIALASAGLLLAVRGETHQTQPAWMLPALVAAAVASVLWWSYTESHGRGDLRPYLLMQGAPLLFIPLWHWIYGAPRAERVAFGIAILLYALAKLFELGDRAVFDMSGFISGHTIKHLLAAAAAAVLTANMVRRNPLRQSAALRPDSVGIL